MSNQSFGNDGNVCQPLGSDSSGPKLKPFTASSNALLALVPPLTLDEATGTMDPMPAVRGGLEIDMDIDMGMDMGTESILGLPI